MQESGQMTWRINPSYSMVGDNTKMLYLRRNESEPWKLYTQSPWYVQDSVHFSKGYLTFLRLHKLGWQTVKE